MYLFTYQTRFLTMNAKIPVEWLKLMKLCFNRFTDDALEVHQPSLDVLLEEAYRDHFDELGIPLHCAIPNVWRYWLEVIHHQCINHAHNMILFGPTTVHRELLNDLEQLRLDRDSGILPNRIHYPVCLPVGSFMKHHHWYMVADPEHIHFGAILHCHDIHFWEATSKQLLCKNYTELLQLLPKHFSV